MFHQRLIVDARADDDIGSLYCWYGGRGSWVLVETARANGLNPYAYLKLVFTTLPKATTVEDIEALLPWNVDQNALEAMLKVPTFSSQQAVG